MGVCFREKFKKKDWMWICFYGFFTNCKDLPRGTRDGPQFLCGSASLREEKINSSQSRQAAKKRELFLCTHLSEQVSLPYRQGVLCEKKKKNRARKEAKASGSQT